MNGIGWAIEQMRNGDRVRRGGWNGKGMWIAIFDQAPQCEIDVPAGRLRMGHPYVYMSDVNRRLFPWNANNLDLLAEDWEVAPRA